MSQKKREQEQKTIKWESLPLINRDAAGLDIGASEIYAAVPTDRDERPVRSTGTFTPDLYTLADWLAACGIKTVAMESTGVYWIPIYEVLEERGFDVQLINAHHLKHVPGRKSDVQDCQWIQRLHTYGLLTGSFRPEAEMRALRSYLRHRGMLLEYRAAHTQHMQKALQQMNLQLTQVLSDITGLTGMAIIRAILVGERDPKTLARLRDKHCHASEEEIIKALTGNYRAEHLFALQQAVALYDFYTEQIRLCDEQILKQYGVIKPVCETLPDEHDDDSGTLPPPAFSAKRTHHGKNSPAFDVRSQLYRLTGVDLVAIDGLNDSSAQAILAEIGTDMSKFKSEKHFCSWLGLAPHNDISGGKVLRSHTLKTNNRAAHMFRLAAQAAGKTKSALGSYYRRKRAHLGPQKAVIATAHKLARIVYHMLKDHTPYHDIGSEAYDKQQRERELANLKRKATQLGYTLAPQQA
jgi:transposase